MSRKVKNLTDLGMTPLRPFDSHLSEICSDSRCLKTGALFAALPGVLTHGASFIPEALARGAIAVLTDPKGYKIAQSLNLHDRAAFVVVEDARAALAAAAALWFETQPPTMIAVTGTNGKTSVASFCRQIWNELGFRSVNIGTTGVEGTRTAPLIHTTPDPITLHRLLSECYEDGITHGAMEASSHGLVQNRLDGVKICAAGFTNCTHDHLDYHDSFDDYFAAKVSLFDRILSPGGVAVLNVDDNRIKKLAQLLKNHGQPCLTVGHCSSADLQLIARKYDVTGQTVRFSYKGISYQTFFPLIGGFQGENVLLAAGLCMESGLDERDVFGNLHCIRPLRGRMQHAATRANGATIFVDYAHTPNALETAINAFRPHVMGRLITIIGAGGDRDPQKRSLMGAAAAKCSDIIIVTDDNPRTEDPNEIRRMILEGTITHDKTFEFGDRAEAIIHAVDMLDVGDGLLITGKGHETEQIIGEDVLPFNDVEQASMAVAALDEFP